MGAAPGRHPLTAAVSNWQALRYSQRLLADLQVSVGAVEIRDEHPAQAWARSGLMFLTGRADGSPLMCPVPVTACAEGALAALRAMAPVGALDGLDAAQLLAERAAIAGLSRSGAQSCGGSARLLAAADGYVVVNLARAEDWTLLPAWLGIEGGDWSVIAGAVRDQPINILLEQGQQLGLAIANAAAISPLRDWCQIERSPARFSRSLVAKSPFVVDLSSLWAGPLCSHLLQCCGAEVIKVESLRRPDGARQGPRKFFDLLNAGKRSVALDFTQPEGRRQLATLIERADIVIEASRPRALRQLGIDAERIVLDRPGMTWISITGYGRQEPEAQWVAYGDDAAVSAGLSEVLFKATGERCFVSDAIADPLTGIHAALAGWAVHLQGGGLVSLALCDVVNHVLHFDLPTEYRTLCERQSKWTALATNVLPPISRPVTQRSAELGADTRAVLASLC